MNGESDSRFLELAARTLAGTSTSDEVTELRDLIANDPACNAEFRRLESDVPLIREALTLCLAAQAPPSELSPEILSALRRATKKVLMTARWKRRIPFLMVAMVLFSLVITWFVYDKKHPPVPYRPVKDQTSLIPIVKPIIQIALCDRWGTLSSRPSAANEHALSSIWPEATVADFQKDKDTALVEWQKNWPAAGTGPVVKITILFGSSIIPGMKAGEIIVEGHWNGSTFYRTISLQNGSESEWQSSLQDAAKYVGEKTK